MIYLKQTTLALSLSVLLGTAFSASALADNSPNSQCAQAFDQCLKACDDDFPEQPAKRAACVPVCSGKYAACDAGVAYEKAKPWLEEQANKTKDFFEGLIDQMEKEAADPVPQKKTRDNSI